jgi:hypothetical protein
MEGRENPHMVKYKAITNDWNYDASCTLTSLLVWDLENFKCLVFVVQSVQGAVFSYEFGQTKSLISVLKYIKTHVKTRNKNILYKRGVLCNRRRMN